MSHHPPPEDEADNQARSSRSPFFQDNAPRAAANTVYNNAGDPFLRQAFPAEAEAERIVLGSILLVNNLIHEVITYSENALQLFFLDSHRRIYSKMVTLSENNQPIEMVLLSDELKRAGEFEQVGGATYISSLMDGVTKTESLVYYLNVLARKAKLRREINIGNQLIAEAFDEEDEPETIAERAQNSLFNDVLDRTTSGPRFESVEELLPRTMDILQQRMEHPSMVTGVPSGFTDLDMLTSGWQKGDLTYIAARPSQGKTALMLELAKYAAKNGSVVGLISLEMTASQLLERMLSSEARIDAHRLRVGYINREEGARLADAIHRVNALPIHINESTTLSVVQAHSLVRRLKARVGCDLVLVDYTTLLDPPESNRREGNRQVEVSLISRRLKAIAKDCDVPVIALAQLSRSSEQRRGHEPRLSDLRESGSLEQDADNVVFIHREEVYEPTDENQGLAELILAKQRNGPIGKVQLCFLKEFGRFENMWRE